MNFIYFVFLIISFFVFLFVLLLNYLYFFPIFALLFFLFSYFLYSFFLFLLLILPIELLVHHPFLHVYSISFDFFCLLFLILFFCRLLPLFDLPVFFLFSTLYVLVPPFCFHVFWHSFLSYFLL